MFAMRDHSVADLALYFTKWHKAWNDARLQIASKVLNFK